MHKLQDVLAHLKKHGRLLPPPHRRQHQYPISMAIVGHNGPIEDLCLVFLLAPQKLTDINQSKTRSYPFLTICLMGVPGSLKASGST